MVLYLEKNELARGEKLEKSQKPRKIQNPADKKLQMSGQTAWSLDKLWKRK